jgi:PIN domain nuclease of toxin-antitoxin system
LIVLDTHVLLWMDAQPGLLGPAARQSIAAAWPHGEVAVSAITFWEVAMLRERGRIEMPMPVDAWRAELLAAGLRELPLDGGTACRAVMLQGLHRDPADRFIVAAAGQASARLLTADALILGWEGPVERVDARL